MMMTSQVIIAGEKTLLYASDLNSDILPYGVLLVILSPDKTLFVDYKKYFQKKVSMRHIFVTKNLLVDAKG